jgi:hypothetical protein
MVTEQNPKSKCEVGLLIEEKLDEIGAKLEYNHPKSVR